MPQTLSPSPSHRGYCNATHTPASSPPDSPNHSWTPGSPSTPTLGECRGNSNCSKLCPALPTARLCARVPLPTYSGAERHRQARGPAHGEGTLSQQSLSPPWGWHPAGPPATRAASGHSASRGHHLWGRNTGGHSKSILGLHMTYCGRKHRQGKARIWLTRK